MTLEVRVQARLPIAIDMGFQLDAGQLLAVVGPSGAGKSTLLRMIAGLVRPETGQIKVAGETWLDLGQGIDLATHLRRVGMVFQTYALFPHMTALENVKTALAAPDPVEAERLLALVKLEGFGGRRSAELSGGQQQRVAMARALARKPKVLLLDEPFSAVDRVTRETLYSEIIALRAHLDMPVVLVTHDVHEAQLLADQMLVVDRGQVVAKGSTAEVMANPEALRVMGLREAAAMLRARVAAHLPDGLSQLEAATGPLFLPRVEAEPGTWLRVRIMAHDVILSKARPEGLSAQNILAGQVARIVPGGGPGVMVHVIIGEDEVLARITRRAVEQMSLTAGDNVHVILKTMSVARGHLTMGKPTPV